MVVTHAVAVGEERLPGILRSQKTYLQILSVTESVTHPMLVLATKIAVAVALAGIERDLCGSYNVVFAVFQDVAQL